MKNNRSFTLLELTLVIAILGIFAVLLFPNYLASLARSRNARRKGDIKALQDGLEQYYSSCSYVYPTAGFTSIQCGTNPAIISAIPVDPKDASNYSYNPTGTAPNINGFSLCANKMEAESPTGYCVYSQQ